MRKTTVALALGAAAALAPLAFSQHPAAPPPGPAVIHPDETRLRNLRQLTFGGQNAEGYWSADGQSIVYQRMNDAEGVMCDQEYVADLATGKSRMVSTGKGRVTCGYFYDGGRRGLYASPHLADPACPPPADHSKGSAWPRRPPPASGSP